MWTGLSILEGSLPVLNQVTYLQLCSWAQRDQRNSHSGLKGDICKDLHCSTDRGGREVEINLCAITGGETVKCGECEHGGYRVALEDLKNIVLDKIRNRMKSIACH